MGSEVTTEFPPIDVKSPPPEWRAVQHRVRNDLQTLAALWRLARRRATNDELVEAFPSWLNSLAAVYDSVPLWQRNERIPMDHLVAAIRARCDFGARFNVESVGESRLPAQMAVVSALGVEGLLGYAATAAEPGKPIKVVISGEKDVTRIEAVFASAAKSVPWPPLGVSLAADAAGASYATGPDGDDMVAVLVIPCP
jgi:hypothetical protein